MATETETELVEERENDAAELLQHLMPYWRYIAGALLLFFVAFGGFNLIAGNRKRAAETGWTDFLAATANRDPVRLAEVASYSGGPVTPWAQQAAAQAKLVEGSSALYTDREKANRLLQEALDGFSTSIESSRNHALIQQRSMWGAAQAKEGLNKLTEAKEAYQKLIDAWPDSSLAKQAQMRVESLNDPATGEFYEWFFTQKPPSQLPPSGQVPNLPFSAPDTPDITVPSDPSADSTPDAGDSSATDGDDSGGTVPFGGDAPADDQVTEPPAVASESEDASE